MSSPDALHPGKVLVVDDDPTSLRLLCHILERQGYQVRRARGGLEARDTLSQGLHNLDCVLTDYQMPDIDGLGLLVWLSGHADAPSVVIVTGEGEKETITASLRHGASDYLEKPVDPRKLIDAVRRAVGNTAYRRQVSGLESAAQRIAEAQQWVTDTSVGRNVHYYHRARYALGGDSVCGFDIGNGRRLYLISDVSGHDLDSAFITAYFQGVVRGMTERRATVPEILSLFNHLLLNEWSGSQNGTSISLCGIEVSEDQTSATVFRNGAPLTVYSDGEGRARTLASGNSHPLGWFDSAWPAVERLKDLAGGSFYVWTDGLEDLAEECGVSPLAVAFRFLETGDGESLVAGALDDVLCARIDLVPEEPRKLRTFVPILAACYGRGQAAEVDSLQESWKRSLLMVVPGMDPAFLYDMLLCCREAVLNGLDHGCRSGECARFVLSYSRETDSIRAYASDPGPGHGNVLERAGFDPESENGGRGLVLIRALTDAYSIERGGAELMMEWKVRKPGQEDRKGTR